MRINCQLPSAPLAAYYDEQECAAKTNFKTFNRAMGIASLAMLGIALGPIGCRLIALEMLGVLQLAYYSVGQHFSSINLYIYQLSGLRFTTGINVEVFNESHEKFIIWEELGKSRGLPEVLRQSLGVKTYGYFINNFNIVYLILIGWTAIMGGVLVLLKIYNMFKQHSKVGN